MPERRTKTQREYIPKYIKGRVYESQNRICAHCGKELTFQEATIDHIIPLNKGGTNEESNYAILCEDCNKDKSDLVLNPVEYLGHLPKEKLVKLAEKFNAYLHEKDFLSDDCLFETDSFEIDALTEIKLQKLRRYTYCRYRIQKLNQEDAIRVMTEYLMANGAKRDGLPATYKDLVHPVYAVSSTKGLCCHITAYAVKDKDGHITYVIEAYPVKRLRDSLPKQNDNICYLFVSIAASAINQANYYNNREHFDTSWINIKLHDAETKFIKAFDDFSYARQHNGLHPMQKSEDMSYGGLTAKAFELIYSKDSTDFMDLTTIRENLDKNTEAFENRTGSHLKETTIIEKEPLVQIPMDVYSGMNLLDRVTPLSHSIDVHVFLEAVAVTMDLTKEEASTLTHDNTLEIAMGTCIIANGMMCEYGRRQVARRMRDKVSSRKMTELAIVNWYKQSTGKHDDAHQAREIADFYGIDTAAAAKIVQLYLNTARCIPKQ